MRDLSIEELTSLLKSKKEDKVLILTAARTLREIALKHYNSEEKEEEASDIIALADHLQQYTERM